LLPCALPCLPYLLSVLLLSITCPSTRVRLRAVCVACVRAPVSCPLLPVLALPSPCPALPL